MNLQIKMLISLAFMNFFFFSFGCGENITTEPETWRLTEQEEPNLQQAVAIEDLEQAFQECSDLIDLDCLNGDFIS